jgi:hypothetical protein
MVQASVSIMVSVCLTEPWGDDVCQNDNPGGDMVSDTCAGRDIQWCSEDMRYILYVHSCYINSSVGSGHTVHVRSISSDQNVYSMLWRLQLGYIKSK